MQPEISMPHIKIKNLLGQDLTYDIIYHRYIYLTARYYSMKRILLGIFTCFLTSLAFAASIIPTAVFHNPVDNLINRVDPAVNIGIVVTDLNTGKTLYQRNPNRPFIPASNMKLFSDAAALLALGPDYRFKSQLSTDATALDEGVLKGSLYLSLPGDPSFTQKNLDELLAPLATLGVKQIEGNIILVSSNSSINAYAPGRMATDNKYSYGAPIAPLMLDENRLSITVNPNYKAGMPALIELNHPHTGLIIDNQIKTASSPSGCGVDFSINNENHLVARGCIGVGQWAIQQRIPIINPLTYAQGLIRAHLAALNIKLDGQVELGHAPISSLLVASHQSKPITQLMADTLKPSDNVYADSLFLHAAAKLNGAPLNWTQAQTVVKKFLQEQTGIGLQSAALVDGSGLSRHDLLTAQQTVDLLRYLHNRFPLAYEYIAALPIAGQDGTLQKRFRKPTQQGLLRAKTGTMSGVTSLSGYLYTANGHTLAFAIFINKKPSGKAISGRALIDDLCDYFLKLRPDHRSVVQAINAHERVAYQQQPSHTEKQRSRFAKWRRLESALKQALQGQAITVVFRGDELELQDHGADIHKVWSSLQNLSKKYTFTVALQSASTPTEKSTNPLLLWIKTPSQASDVTRTWVLKDALS
jgi:serine-type D-Ala-D-Ala carboxypeptidase/endopeptidase (penicillin-binding protein 4)